METFLPVLFIIAMFIIQAVMNYRKEQEKVRKRVLKPDALQTEPAQPELHAAYEGLAADDMPQTPRLPKKEPQEQEFRRFGAYELSDRASEDDSDEFEKYRSDFDMREAVIMAAILERPYK